MTNFITWLCGILVTVLAALFAVPHFIDWNGYRGVFEEEASRVLSRDVRVGGDVNVRLLPTPYVRFEKLSIADTSGVTGAPLFKAKSFTMWLSVPPLLKGLIEARRIELDRPVVRLARRADGKPNWADVRLSLGQLPIVPKDVAFEAVSIIEGEIGYDIAGSGPLFRVSGLNGELQAPGLQGPYAFRGTANLGDRLSDLRISTSEFDEDGGTRLRISMADPDGRIRHVIDGNLADPVRQPRFAGTLLSQYFAKTGGRGRQPDFEVRGKLEASTDAARLEDLVAAFETTGQPQVVTGQVSAIWGKRHDVSADLRARWLDFDQLNLRLMPPSGDGPAGEADAGTGQAGTGQAGDGQAGEGLAGDSDPGLKPRPPLAIARQLFAALIERLPDNSDIKVLSAIEQVTLGGEAVSNLLMEISSAKGPLELRTLSASLPGGARLELSGQLTPGDLAPAFDGTVFVGGPSVTKALKWAVPEYADVEDVRDGDFNLSGTLSFSRTLISLEDATAEFSGLPVRGRFKWQEAPKSRVELELDGHEIDTGWFGIRNLRAGDWFGRMLAGQTGGEAPGPSETSAAEAMHYDIKVRAGRLLDAQTRLADVEAHVVADAGRIAIRKFSLRNEDGLSVNAEGEVEALPRSGKVAGAAGQAAMPLHGQLTWTIDANAPDAGSSLVQLFRTHGLIDTGQSGFERTLRELTPFRVAGQTDFGSRMKRAVDIQFDGLVQGRRGVGRVELDGGWTDWRKAPLTARFSFESDDIVRLSQLAVQPNGDIVRRMRGLGRQTDGAKSRTEGRLLIAFEGRADSGGASLAQITSENLKLGWRGRMRLEGEKLLAEGGTISVEDTKLRPLLALAGIRTSAAGGDASVKGTIQVETLADAHVLGLRDVMVGADRFTGQLKIAMQSRDARPVVSLSGLEEPVVFEVDGQLSSKRLQLASLVEGLSAVTVSSPPVPREAVASRTGSESIEAGGAGQSRNFTPVFSRTAFDAAVLDHLKGRIRLSADTFDLGGGLASKNAELAISMAGDGKAEFELNARSSAGGKLKISGDLRAAAVGLETRGEFGLEGVKLANIEGASGTALASGRLDVRTSFAGKGLSALSLVQSLRGSGVASIRDLVVRGLSAERVGAAPDSLLTGPAEIPEGALEDAVLAAVDDSRLAVGTRSLKLALRDGVVEAVPLVVTTSRGVTRSDISVDLASLSAQSRWQVTSSSQVEDTPEWPSVRVLMAGRLSSLGRWNRTVDFDGLSRELSVRKMEWNVRELERLRREDEERARQARERAAELKRQRQEAEERARAEAEERAVQQRALRLEQQQSGGAGQGAGLRQGGPSEVVSEPLPQLDPAEQTRIEAEKEARRLKMIEQRRRAARAAARLRAQRERERRARETWSPFGPNF